MQAVLKYPGIADLVLVTMLLAVCCSPSEPLRMKTIELGTAVDESSRVVSPIRLFAPGDVIHASIEIAGFGSPTVTVQWLVNNQIVSTETRAIEATGSSRLAFHFVPPGGWPVGKHMIVFWLDPAEKHAAEFDVR